MNLKTDAARDVANSMIVSGSTVALVGGILTVTKTWAFVAMVAFGSVILTLGVLAARRNATRKLSDGTQSAENIAE